MAGRKDVMLVTARSASSPSRGFTLIELTVVLSVIVTLALVLTPSIANFLNDARSARATKDCSVIATAIVQFYRDTGFYPQWRQARDGGPGISQHKLHLLVGPGRLPVEDQPSLWTTGEAGSLAEQLVADIPGYSLRTPSSHSGWNGPYLMSEINPDPWGNRYLVNIALIETTVTAADAAGRPKPAVWVLSAGPNGTIDTPYRQPGLVAATAGDDIGFRLQ